jgi:hypothetical protein
MTKQGWRVQMDADACGRSESTDISHIYERISRRSEARSHASHVDSAALDGVDHISLRDAFLRTLGDDIEGGGNWGDGVKLPRPLDGELVALDSLTALAQLVKFSSHGLGSHALAPGSASLNVFEGFDVEGAGVQTGEGLEEEMPNCRGADV